MMAPLFFTIATAFTTSAVIRPPTRLMPKIAAVVFPVDSVGETVPFAVVTPRPVERTGGTLTSSIELVSTAPSVPGQGSVTSAHVPDTTTSAKSTLVAYA